ncbi:hypothetical protein A2870_03615 [Candidatus Curtissbacteria bacterium RIFCSPHIGHO2_01_FULL_41_11]|uniref:DNA polymerase III subunit delta n=1 Tax=Candidatus Curtissbacteria bacterium RIFCSPHIGHO2_01_FULL_41_11 TaxID=1797711 RepID=A0A1F5G5U3_9BACT|nr:MAG: hypothetical protein A2870_03615 [Candidatus Curtissbacteria bacterium RIFCSPHIGHO2_01_FULL_41_11]
MSQFQSYLIIGPSQNPIREKTTSLAKEKGIDIKKTSPDIFFLRPEKNSITIDQVRKLKQHIFQKPFKEKFKFIVIEDAGSAKIEAQNALLKILEEPPTQAILVLESQNKALFLPTIISRVVIIKTKTNLTSSKILPEKDLETALLKISEIEDPKQFLDEQIIALTNQLVTNIDSNRASSDKITVIEKYKEAKQMIIQNVNPTFVLTNLVLSTNPASK